MTTEKRSGQGKALSIVRILLAAALVTWVASRVSFRDRAERRDGAGALLETREGQVEGSWNAPVVPFRDPWGTVEALASAEGWHIRPGIGTLFGNLGVGLYSAGVALFFLTPLLTVVRWRMLLRASGIDPGFGEACRLTWVGLFFNLVVPGLTGGDVVKAILVARSTERREAAVVSVFVDRVIGILALAVLAGVVVAPQRDRFAEIARGLTLFLGALLAASLLLLSRRPRRLLRIDRIVRSLPFSGVIARVDEAVLAYRDHPRTLAAAFALSIANHLGILVGVVLIARALGDPLPIRHYLVLVPVITMLSSAPIAPAGWGVGETLYGEFFRRYGSAFGSSFELGVALSLLYRLAWMIVSLPGGVFGLKRQRRVEAG